MNKPLRMTSKLIAIIALSAAFSGPTLAANPATKPIRVILFGDSIVVTKSGYGDVLRSPFQPAISCINLTRGDRGSGSFRAEGRWNEVQNLLRDGVSLSTNYVLNQDVDYTHLDTKGATYFSHRAMAELIRAVPSIMSSLRSEN